MKFRSGVLALSLCGSLLGAVWGGSSFFYRASRAAEESNQILEALKFIGDEQNEGERLKGYKLLEKIVAENPKESQERFDASLILSLVSDSISLQKPRSFYAEAALRDKKRMAQVQRSTYFKVQRTLGDALLDNADFKGSRSSFLALSKSPEALDREYALYKSGWIDVNESNPRHAFNTWINYLESPDSDSSKIRSSLLRDLIRVWVEGSGFGPEASARLVKVIKKPGDFAEVDEGLRLALRFMTTKKTSLDRFQKLVAKSPLGTRAAQVVFVTGLAVKTSGPCAFLEWLPNQIDKNFLDKEVLLDGVIACYKSETAAAAPSTKKKTSKDSKNARSKIILSTLLQLDPSGLKRLPIAELADEAQKFTDSCPAYMGIFETTQESSLVPRLAQSCARAVDQVSAQNRTSLNQKIAEFVSARSPKPIGGSGSDSWLVLLDLALNHWLASRSFTVARTQLEALAPLRGSPNDKFIPLWGRWARAIPPTDPENLQKKLVLAKLAALPSSSAGALTVRVGLALEAGMLSDLWLNETSLENQLDPTDGTNRTLLVALLEQSFLRLQSQPQDPALSSSMGKSSTGQTLLELDEILKREDLKISNLVSIEKKFGESNLLKLTHMQGDLLQLKKLADKRTALNETQLDPNKVSFVDKLTRNVRTLQELVANGKDSAWTDPAFAKQGKLLAQKACTDLLSKLAALQVPKSLSAEELTSWNTEMKSVADRIESWKLALGNAKAPEKNNQKLDQKLDQKLTEKKAVP